jgi:tRNA dimethylallyltransferase
MTGGDTTHRDEGTDLAPDGAKSPAILTIVGPTAVGKTAVALLVARELGCEIVSADSRQIYRGMDIGTAKPTSEERGLVHHHLIDIVEPRESYDAVRFADDAELAIGQIRGRGVEPIVVGGTGFYIASLFDGLFEGPGRSDGIRRELEDRVAAEGGELLHSALASVDPVSAARIHPNDTQRLVRALEVYRSTGRTLTDWQAEGTRKPAFRPRYFGLTMPRESLYERIERRVDAMLVSGLLDEVRALHESGRLRPGMPAASAVGYRELLPVVAGQAGGVDEQAGDVAEQAGGVAEQAGGIAEQAGGVAEAVHEIKTNTRRFAKRQLTWFSSVDGVTWIDVASLGPEETARTIVVAQASDGKRAERPGQTA